MCLILQYSTLKSTVVQYTTAGIQGHAYIFETSLIEGPFILAFKL